MHPPPPTALRPDPTRTLRPLLLLLTLALTLLLTLPACSSPPGFALKTIPDSTVPADFRTRLASRDWVSVSWLVYQESPGTRFVACLYRRQTPDRVPLRYDELDIYLDRGGPDFWRAYIPDPFGRQQPVEFAAGWVGSDDEYLAAFGVAFHPGVKLIQGRTMSGWQGSVEPVNGFWLLEATPPVSASGVGSGPGSTPGPGPKDEWVVLRAIGASGELIHAYHKPNWAPLARWSPEV